jgi:hypothetical protein
LIRLLVKHNAVAMYPVHFSENLGALIRLRDSS